MIKEYHTFGITDTNNWSNRGLEFTLKINTLPSAKITTSNTLRILSLFCVYFDMMRIYMHTNSSDCFIFLGFKININDVHDVYAKYKNIITAWTVYEKILVSYELQQKGLT